MGDERSVGDRREPERSSSPTAARAADAPSEAASNARGGSSRADEQSDGDCKHSGGNSVAILTPADEHVPDPEVRTDRPKRRTFTAEYKQRILALADSCTPRERGALLRREGLYGSHLVDWRRARDEAVAAGLAPQKRGPKAQVVNPLAARVAELEQSERQLKERLRKAEVVIEIQKKVSQLLGVTPSSPDRSEPFE